MLGRSLRNRLTALVAAVVLGPVLWAMVGPTLLAEFGGDVVVALVLIVLIVALT